MNVKITYFLFFFSIKILHGAYKHVHLNENFPFYILTILKSWTKSAVQLNVKVAELFVLCFVLFCFAGLGMGPVISNILGKQFQGDVPPTQGQQKMGSKNIHSQKFWILQLQQESMDLKSLIVPQFSTSVYCRSFSTSVILSSLRHKWRIILIHLSQGVTRTMPCFICLNRVYIEHKVNSLIGKFGLFPLLIGLQNHDLIYIIKITL